MGCATHRPVGGLRRVAEALRGKAPRVTSSNARAEEAVAVQPKRRRIDIIAEAEFLSRLDEMDLVELRARRDMCDELEVELSYYRRLLHGRLDIVAAENARREGRESRALTEMLPEILAAGERREGGRLPRYLAPMHLPKVGRRRIDHVLDDSFLARLGTLPATELAEIIDTIGEVEKEISTQRKVVQHAFDTLTAELVRRYQGGTASVDELLE